jgi:hypothetical protein
MRATAGRVNHVTPAERRLQGIMLATTLRMPRPVEAWIAACVAGLGRDR